MLPVKGGGSRWILGSLAVLGVGGGLLFGIGPATRLAAACLATVNGVASKMAHLNQPFGSGSTVESVNPILGITPDFSLTERSGRTIGRQDLSGTYWVASFLFTRCATSCPRAVAQLSRLQEELPPDVRLVSFSVDPEHDSPEVLSGYADRAGADLDRWLFLTGDKEVITRTIREGFHLALEENANAPPGWEVTHSPRFALVDPQGRIRGYYESTDDADLRRLLADIERLRGPDHAKG